MPIKIPKAFPRRKSSGNVLDEVQSTEPSFKVYSRPQTGHKSLDINLAQQKPLPVRKNSYEQEDDDLFTVTRPDAANRYVSPFHQPGTRPDYVSGSGGTANSLSTAAYDSAASSTRLSSSSTIPSSVDARSDNNVHPIAQQEPPPTPAHQSKSSTFLRNAGRTFSFGGKSKPAETSEPPVPPMPVNRGQFSIPDGRDRAMTASTVSTATPPRLLESDLSINTSDLDNFESMFDGIGARSRDQSPVRTVATGNSMAPAGSKLRPEPAIASRSAPPRPVNLDWSAQIESSPYSWTSEHSANPLIKTPGSVDTVLHKSPQLNSGAAFGKPMKATTSMQKTEPIMDDNMFADTPSRPRAYSRPGQASTPLSPPVRPTNQSHFATTITGTSLQNSPILERDDSTLDPALLASVELATRYQDSKPAPVVPLGKKVMTPAEFERYKRQKDETHRLNKVFQNTRPESDDSDDNYDDLEEEDETERDRQVAKQRRKQEAHLAVYRQTMIKVTGEGPTAPSRSNHSISILPPASQSATDLANQFSSISFDKSPARSSDEEEDDDVPLGILAAHGFPNKNRPPNRLANSSSNPNLRASVHQSQQQAPPSVAGESMKRGSLPVFARHLPEDPYYGASLVNQTNRESMAMNSGNLMPSGAATAHPHHPSGLVGVIAGEERARAMRRGSPNAATGTFDLPPSMPGHPGMSRSQTTGSMPNMMIPPNMVGMPGMPMMPNMPGVPNMLSPGDQAQIQMSQQMTQMMQMQMQWMQQMQQFMANQGQNGNMPNMPNMPNMSNVSAAASMPRPQSVPLQNQSSSEPRAMSMLGPPSMFGWSNGPSGMQHGPGSTYAPSIAPSERSNIGLASRYRPVSTVQEPEQPWNQRSSTMTSATLRPWSQFGGGSKQAPTVRKVAVPAEDEDDEQGWAEMKAKKDQKKKTWKLRKGQNVLQELYNGPP